MLLRELFQEEDFCEIFREVEEFTCNKLKDYNDRVKRQSFPKQGKEIFDAVWGNVEFSGGETMILDSPLIQRLRKIKQLGLAYFVYCGSDYSRFYHTIGVTYLADCMVGAINKCELGTTREKKNDFRVIVRLAAIFHDSGHMFLSHVSEHYFGRNPQYPRNKDGKIKRMLDKFEKATRKKASLHEMLSCMIVNTSEVKRLLRQAVDIDEIGWTIEGKNKEQKMKQVIEYISCLIIGAPIDPYILPYSSIINGPIDADKCDYLARDSHVTRVPVAVDISRITKKLSVVEVEDINYSSIWQESANTKIKLYELAMKDSAEKALFQLCIARTIMFDSVYYHHKVMTAETEFRIIIHELANLQQPVFNSFTEILEYTDEDFSKYYFESLRNNRSKEDCLRIDRAEKRLNRLYERELAKRIACFRPVYLIGRQGAVEKLLDDIFTKVDSANELFFIDRIKEEYNRIRKHVGMMERTAEDIHIFIVKAPTNIFGHSKIQVPIDLKNGSKRDFKGYELVSSRETSDSASYIVTNEEERLLIYMALEKVLHKYYQVLLSEESMSCGKFDIQQIADVAAKLFIEGYYDDAPQLLSESLIYNHIVKQKIERIADKFSTYEGPGGYKVKEKEVEHFFKQILCACKNKAQCKEVAEGIYILLEDALFINRGFLSGKIEGKLREIGKEEKELHIVPLGGLKDSGKHLMYYWNDVKDKKVVIHTHDSLEKALEADSESILFFDDGSFSGTQLISIMQEYMDIKDRKTNEQHVMPLKKKQRSMLKTKKLIFFFVVFNSEKEENIRIELKKLGLTNVQFFYLEDMHLKCLEPEGKKIFKDEEQRSAVKELLAAVGDKIMRSRKMEGEEFKEGWNEKRVQEAALGYNNAQQMVFLESSVPTYTITPFWQEGKVDGWEWKPLFRRTDK